MMIPDMRYFALPILLALPLAAGPVRVYVANSDGDNITIIDPDANKAIGEIKVSNNPHGLVFSPDKKRLYVSSEGDNLLDVVDRATAKVIRRIALGPRPNNLAITPDGKRVYICIRQEDWVGIVDTASLELVKHVPVGRYPHNVYNTPDGKGMIATSLGDKKLTVIDIAGETPKYEIPTPGVPRPVAMDAANLYVQLSDLHGFIVIDFLKRDVIDKIMLPPAPADAQPLIAHTFSHGIAVSPDGKTLWVTSMLNNSVSVYSLPDRKLVDTVQVGRGPDWMAFTPDGKRVFVSNAGADSVSSIDVTTRKELARIPVGKIPKRIIAVTLP